MTHTKRPYKVVGILPTPLFVPPNMFYQGNIPRCHTLYTLFHNPHALAPYACLFGYYAGRRNLALVTTRSVSRYYQGTARCKVPVPVPLNIPDPLSDEDHIDETSSMIVEACCVLKCHRK